MGPQARLLARRRAREEVVQALVLRKEPHLRMQCAAFVLCTLFRGGGVQRFWAYHHLGRYEGEVQVHDGPEVLC